MSPERLRILVAEPVDEERLAVLRAAFPHVTFELIPPYPEETPLPVPLIEDCAALFADFPPSNLHQMRALRWLQLGSAGYAQLADLPLKTMGVRVCNASGVNDVPIAEWCILMMLTFERSFLELRRLQEQRTWQRNSRLQAELRGHRIGIIGYGSIGREVARLSHALGLEVWALNRRPIGPTHLKFTPAGTGDPGGLLPHRCFTTDQMEQFLPYLDYLVMAAALNPRTHGLLGERELRLLPSSAVILNPARAQLIDEAAFVRALSQGWIAGAALDSHYREPLPTNDATWELPNTVVTPHISGSNGSPHYVERVWELFSLNLKQFLDGQQLLNEVPWADLAAT